MGRGEGWRGVFGEKGGWVVEAFRSEVFGAEVQTLFGVGGGMMWVRGVRDMWAYDDHNLAIPCASDAVYRVH